MCCLSPSLSASATSSRRGQIVASQWPPGSSSCSNPRSDGPPPSPAPPPRAVGTDDEELADRPAKRARPESGCVDGVRTADRPAGDGRDRISDLPDAVLLSVLSFLPLRDAGRTAVLSSRWRGLFDQSLLDFNACQPFPPEGGRGSDWVIRAITDIFAARPRVRIRSFRFVMYGRGFDGRLGVVDGWFRSLARRGLRELDVDMFYTAPMPTLPKSLLVLASLETLKVFYCRFPDAGSAPVLRLPALKKLDLSNVNVSQESLHAILSHCTSLECVKLKNITGVDKICLRSKSLARLYGDFGDLKELVVEDAPNLEELVGIGLPSGKAKVKIVCAPKLKVLGYLGIRVRPLVMHDTVFDGGIRQLRTLMHTVKTLAIQVPLSEKGYTVFVAQLLKCFPCLEVLHVECLLSSQQSDYLFVNYKSFSKQRVPDDALHALLSHCTALERLKMRSMRLFDCSRVHIRSPRFKILSSDAHFDELFVEDAPNLEWLLGDNLYQRGVRFRVTHAPRLEFLGYLGMGSLAIEIGETIFTKDQILVKTLMPSLKTLAVESRNRSVGYINWFMQLLKLFPRLETIYIRSEFGPMIEDDASESWAALESTPCIDKRLKKAMFEIYRGHEWQREMAKFLHRRSSFLETMEFHCLDDIRTTWMTSAPSKEWVREQQELLCFDIRASRDARFFFFFKRHLHLKIEFTWEGYIDWIIHLLNLFPA
ncbi:hypothetical protein BAE44_0021371 [Dichanthelium oligosanthes]|uniref:F-box domain-containing protein n=1 Tax=Dichanthelium oligosanthes TaxID=888268 RepID=A0A1E5UXJ0_9POAL|nr:hypothetical protein BAE44_0021371 [Dichanthelium oligosanthes]